MNYSTIIYNFFCLKPYEACKTTTKIKAEDAKSDAGAVSDTTMSSIDIKLA